MTASKTYVKKKYSLAEPGINDCKTIPQEADKVCNLNYLLNISRGNKKIIDSIVTVFFIETKIELIALDIAIKKRNYTAIRHIAHKIKSAFSILGITALEPVFKEMEQLNIGTSSISNIEIINRSVHFVFNKAKEEMMFEI